MRSFDEVGHHGSGSLRFLSGSQNFQFDQTIYRHGRVQRVLSKKLFSHVHFSFYFLIHLPCLQSLSQDQVSLRNAKQDSQTSQQNGKRLTTLLRRQKSPAIPQSKKIMLSIWQENVSHCLMQHISTL